MCGVRLVREPTTGKETLGVPFMPFPEPSPEKHRALADLRDLWVLRQEANPVSQFGRTFKGLSFNRLGQLAA
jgi:hypothetical protein